VCAKTGWEAAVEAGCARAGKAGSKGVERPAGRPFFDVIFTFTDTIVAGDPGHPLSRVQKNEKLFLTTEGAKKVN